MGTRQPAEDGKLTVLASGPGRERLGEMFDAVAAKVIDLGDEVGAGTRMKLVGNSWVLALVEGLAETIALAEQLGVDPRDFLAMIEGGLMFAPYAKIKGEAMIAREFPPSFPLALAAKDAGLIAEAAPDLPLPKLIRGADAQGRRGRARRRGHERYVLGPVSRALVIVDFQNDFTPGGALAVPHGDEIAERINALAASGDYELVVATRDWHPADHGSFAEQGGPWPVHCVAGTPGAQLHPALDQPRST